MNRLSKTNIFIVLFLLLSFAIQAKARYGDGHSYDTTIQTTDELPNKFTAWWSANSAVGRSAVCAGARATAAYAGAGIKPKMSEAYIEARELSKTYRSGLLQKKRISGSGRS